MLPKKSRLTQKSKFNKVRHIANKEGTKYSGKLFHIFWITAKDLEDPSKVGFVISNKFHKSAVKRNQTKRYFREAFRKYSAKIGQGLWVVVHPKFISADKSYEEIDADVAKVLQKISISR